MSELLPATDAGGETSRFILFGFREEVVLPTMTLSSHRHALSIGPGLATLLNVRGFLIAAPASLSQHNRSRI